MRVHWHPRAYMRSLDSYHKRYTSKYLGNGDLGFHETKQEEFDGNIKKILLG